MDIKEELQKTILIFIEQKNNLINLLNKEEDINPFASPSAVVPALKYGYVNIETSSPGEVKVLIINWIYEKIFII